MIWDTSRKLESRHIYLHMLSYRPLRQWMLEDKYRSCGEFYTSIPDPSVSVPLVSFSSLISSQIGRTVTLNVKPCPATRSTTTRSPTSCHPKVALDVLPKGTLDPVYATKAEVLNRAIQDLGFGRYQVSANHFSPSFTPLIVTCISRLVPKR